MRHVSIAITSEQLKISTSYFQHFILHHFSMGKYILVFCKSSVGFTRSNTPWGSKPAHLHVEAFKSLRIRCGPITIDLSCSLIFTLSVTEMQLCTVNFVLLLHVTRNTGTSDYLFQSIDDFAFRTKYKIQYMCITSMIDSLLSEAIITVIGSFVSGTFY